MGYVNCGAYVNGTRPKTKKALKEAMANDPSHVRFDSTSMFDNLHCTGVGIPEGTTLSVVGPDPYTKRSWYATVTDKGKVS